MTSDTDTATQILAVAQQLMQARGYNAFSYADIAEAVNIKKASIHYYFPSKSDLCKAVIHRHRLTLRVQLARIDQQKCDAAQKLDQYLHFYANIQQVPDLICLGGMLAADVQSLSHDVQVEVQSFFMDNEAWLTAIIGQGIQEGVFHAVESAQLEAQLVVAAVQGALLVARSFGDSRRFMLISQRLHESLLS